MEERKRRNVSMWPVKELALKWQTRRPEEIGREEESGEAEEVRDEVEL